MLALSTPPQMMTVFPIRPPVAPSTLIGKSGQLLHILSPLTVKSLKDDWKIGNHEKTINRHSWILIPENEHLHRFKRTVPYDDKTFPYKDLSNNKNSEKKKKHNRIAKNINIGNYISNKSAFVQLH